MLQKTELNKSPLCQNTWEFQWEGQIDPRKMSMASRDRVLSALNFITGEGVNYYWDGVDGNDVEALISDYFDAPTDDEDDHMNDDESENDCDHSIEGNFRPSTKACILNIHSYYHLFL